MKNNTLLSFSNVTKSYGQQNPTTVLQSINFSMEKGESIAIMGASGSGKTTLLSLASALDSLFEGSITLLNHTLGHISTKQQDKIRSEYIGLLLQKPFLIQELSVLENVTLPCLVRGVSQKTALKKACAMLESVMLDTRIIHEKPSVLSPGQAQRVCLARTLMHTPLLLICDEPTASLDANTARHVMDAICHQAHKTGSGLLIATHDKTVAQRCQSVLTITNGHLSNYDEDSTR